MPAKFKNFLKSIWVRFRTSTEKLLGRTLDNFRVEIEVPYVYLGTPGYGAWAFDPRTINKSSVVYSAGVGENISWDKEMIAAYGVKIHALDFTPRTKSFIDKEKASGLSPNFELLEYGLAATDGTRTFYAPYQAKNVSHSIIPRPTASHTFHVKKLSTIMKELGHQHIDILKMDIEGAEYEVLEDMLASGIYPGQLLVEFQHRFEGVGVMKTKRMIQKLQKVGYKIFFISDKKEEFSFLKT